MLARRLAAQFAASAGRAEAGLRDETMFAGLERRPAAVLVAITDRAAPGVLLTCRPDTMASHPGQIAFPGGKLETGEDAPAAALREAEEELGIVPSNVHLIGNAAGFATGSGFHLTPVLGVIPPDLALTPDPREVADWFEAPLRYLLDPANHTARIGNFAGQERPYTEILWDNRRIWGITAAILVNLSARLDWREWAG